MSNTDKREEIIVSLVAALNSMDVYRAVVRKRPSLEEFGQLPDTNFPFLAVVASLPSPERKVVEARSVAAPVVKHVWKLLIEITCYAHDNVTPDSTMGDHYNLIHKAVFKKPLFYQSIEEITDESDDRKGAIIAPYLAFNMKLGVQYSTHEGI